MQLTDNRSSRHYLRLIVAIFMLLAVCYSLLSRLKYAPDEPAHFIYIRSIATHFSIPDISHKTVTSEDSSSSHEAHQPPLYYTIMAVFYWILNTIGASNEVIWRTIRLLNVPIGAIWIAGLFVLFRVLFEENYALIATGFTALIPISPYMSGVITNDVLIAALFTWALVYILKYVKERRISLKDSLILGILTGLSVLTKAQGLILFPLIVIAALFVYKHVKLQDFRLAYGNLLVSLILGILICGGWYIRNILVYGEPMPQSITAPIVDTVWIFTIEPILSLEYLFCGTRDLFAYFWSPFWLVSPYVNIQCYYIFVLVLMLIPLFGIAIRRHKRQMSGGSLLTLLVIALAINYILYIRYILWVDFYAKQQGRLLLPTASAISAYFILGFDSMISRAVYRKVAVIAGCIIMIAANIAVMACCQSQYT